MFDTPHRFIDLDHARVDRDRVLPDRGLGPRQAAQRQTERGDMDTNDSAGAVVGMKACAEIPT